MISSFLLISNQLLTYNKQMFLRNKQKMYSESRQNQKVNNKQNQHKKRTSLPSIIPNHTLRNKQPSLLPHEPIIKYNSQKNISPSSSKYITLKPILNPTSHNYQQTTKPVNQLPIYNPINLSPNKRSTIKNRLPNILSEGKFIKKKQDSIDTSMEEDDKFRQQLLRENRLSFAQPQIWLIKKQLHEDRRSDNCNTRNHNRDKSFVEQIISQNLNNQLINNSTKSTTLITQPLSQLASISISISISISPQKPTSPLLPPQPIQPSQKNNSLPQQTKQKLVGPQAVQKFYSQYKNINRIKQLQQIRNQYNPISIILTILDSYNIPPKRMDIIKLKGNQSILDLNHIGLGHSISLKAISDILQKIHYFKTINLSYNSISFDRVDIIIPQLRGIRKINLSHNRISRQGADLLATTVCVRQKSNSNINSNINSNSNNTQSKNNQHNNNNRDDSSSSSQSSHQQNNYLQDLNLQQNSLSDQSMNLFLINTKSFRHLKILNLNKNFLGNHFALKLKQFLTNQHHLNQLYLHWNDITSKGVKYIFDGLAMNQQLKVLDLSWNIIGYQAIPGISNFFRKNTSLIHLDISNCNISINDTTQLSQSIKQNFTIFGFHYQGNQGTIDQMGFLNPIKQHNDKIKQSLRNQLLNRIKGVQRNFVSDRQNDFYLQNTQKTCWICNGWSQKTITIKKIPQVDQACFIHFDFQEYKGIAMGQIQSNYQITKMFPPKRISFFITKVNKSKQFIHQVAIHYKGLNNFQTHKLLTPLKISNFFIQHKQFKHVQFTQMNVISKMNLEYDELFDERYVYQLRCRPRTYDFATDSSIFIEPKKTKIKRKKQRNKEHDKKTRQLQTIQTFFKQQSQQNTKQTTFIGQCVNFDISNSKIKKLLWNTQEINSIASILQQNYSTFLNVYHHLSNSCVNSVTSMFYISESRLDQFLDFMQFQSRYLSRAKIRLKLIATLSLNDQFSKTQNKTQNIEQRLFNRPQFFEFLVRIAMQKYCKPKKSQEGQNILPLNEGFQKLIQSIKKYESTLSLRSQWRQQHLQSYDISLVIKSYEHFLQSLYDSYAGSNQKNMNTRVQKKMLLNEFKQIFLDSRMRKTRQALKDAQVAFADSKQLQIEEGIREYGLKYNEFLEAMVRMAYSNNFKPVGTQQHKLWQRIDQMHNHHEISHSQELSFQIPLFLRFQGLLKNIYKQNYQIYHSRKMDKLFERGIFSDEIQMLVEILKQRVQQFQQKLRPVINQRSTKKKIKLNSIDDEQMNLVNTNNHQGLNNNNYKITLEYLVKQLKDKYNKMAQELDLNFNDYEEISQAEQHA